MNRGGGGGAAGPAGPSGPPGLQGLQGLPACLYQEPRVSQEPPVHQVLVWAKWANRAHPAHQAVKRWGMQQ